MSVRHFLVKTHFYIFVAFMYNIYMYMANSQYLMYFSAQCMLQSASSHKPGAARVHVATCGGGVLTDPATSIFSLMRCSSFSCARLMLASSRCRCACSRSRSIRRSFSRSTRSSNARRRSYQQQHQQHCHIHECLLSVGRGGASTSSLVLYF